MADYSTLKADIVNILNKSGELQKKSATGALQAGARESIASNKLNSKRSGFTGTVEQALANKIQGRAATQAANIGAGIDAQTGQQVATVSNQLGQQELQDKLAREQALQGMIGNIVGGLGSLAGGPLMGFLGDKIATMGAENEVLNPDLSKY